MVQSDNCVRIEADLLIYDQHIKMKYFSINCYIKVNRSNYIHIIFTV